MTSIIRKIPFLESNADIVTIAYGSANGGPSQEAPSYMLQLAQQRPNETLEILHYDSTFAKPQTSYCATHKDWKLVHEEEGCRIFRHVKYPNFQVKIIAQSFPSLEHRNTAASIQQIQKFCLEKLSQGKTVFLGAHAHSFEDTTSTMSLIQNTFYKRFPNKIHLYIQAGIGEAYIYSKRHSNIMGLFTHFLFWKNRESCFGTRDWSAFKRIFSGTNYSSSDVARVRACMQRFLKDDSVLEQHVNPDPDVKKLVIEARRKLIREEGAELSAFLDDRENHQMQIIPMDAITPATFGMGPAEHPQSTSPYLMTAAAITFLIMAIGFKLS